MWTASNAGAVDPEHKGEVEAAQKEGCKGLPISSCWGLLLATVSQVAPSALWGTLEATDLNLVWSEQCPSQGLLESHRP